jgi:hypothetical protein
VTTTPPPRACAGQPPETPDELRSANTNPNAPDESGEFMNIQPAQQVPANSPQSDQSRCLCHDMHDCRTQATVEINASQLADVAELLAMLDGFLRHVDGIADRLADYLHATGRDEPRPPHWVGYNANLLIDQVSFTTHGLGAYRHQPARVSAGHR